MDRVLSMLCSAIISTFDSDFNQQGKMDAPMRSSCLNHNRWQLRRTMTKGYLRVAESTSVSPRKSCSLCLPA